MNKYELTHPKNGERIYFKSLKEIVEYLEVSYSIFNRKKNSIGLQGAFDYYTNKQDELILIHPITGETLKFDRIKDVVEYLGIAESTFIKKRKQTSSFQKAFDYYANKGRKYTIENTKTGEKFRFPRVADIANYLGVKESSFRRRLEKDQDIQNTFEYYLNKETYKIIHPRTGETLEFKKVKDIYEYLKVSESAFNSRKAKFGLQEAFNYYYKETVTIFGEEFIPNRYKKIYDKFIMPYDNINYRKFRSKFSYLLEIISHEDAIIEIMMNLGYICVDLNKGKFKKISEFAEENNLSEEYVVQKLKEGFKHKYF